jgi:multidrug resistance efflux pump
MSRLRWVVFVVLLVCAAGFKWAMAARAPVARVEEGSIDERVIARAIVIPIDGVAEVRPRVEGRVTRVVVREGDVVKAGDVLAELEVEDLRAEVARQRAERAAVESDARSIREGARPEEQAAADGDLQAARDELAIAADHAAREEKLYLSGSTAEASLETARRAADLARSRVLGAEARMRLARAGGRRTAVLAAEERAAAARESLRAAESVLRRGTLVAPIDGVVIARRIDPGDVVMGAGAAGADTAAFEIADTTKTEVRIEILDADADRIRIGQRVTFTPEGGGPALSEGHVARINPELQKRTIGLEDARVRSDRRVRAAWVTVDGSPVPDASRGGDPEDERRTLAIGQRLEGVIFVGERRVHARVPKSAVQVRDGQALVEAPWGPFARALPVTLGASSDRFVEVTGAPPGTIVRLH